MATLTPAEKVVYMAFIDAPYDGFHADDSARHAARTCDVPVSRVHEIINKLVPGWNGSTE